MNTITQTWRIRLFGTVCVEGLGECFSVFETQRSAKLLSLLALARNGRMRREELADALWPDDFCDATRLRLRKELSRLRKALGPAADALETEGEFVGIDKAVVETDLELVKRAANLAEDDERRPTLLSQASGVATGEFLPGWDDPWVLAERKSADSLRMRVLVAHAENLLTAGRLDEALTATRPAIAHDPCHEAARMIAIRAHAGLGSLASALSEFQQMKRTMKERTGTSPSTRAESLMAQVQSGELSEPTIRPTRPVLPPIPVPIDPFFGRKSELDELTKLLAPHDQIRLVTLTGIGGIGKSRLAIEVALALADSYASLVTFISLAECPTPEASVETLLSHLGWQTSTADRTAFIANSLPNEPCLLVLDNLEHLLPDIARLIKTLLEFKPQLRILATSRQPLKLAGEQTIPLGPMKDEAESMLAELARNARPSLSSNLSDFTALADRLDRIPLALKLAAPRLRFLSPETLLTQLASRFEIMKGDAPDLADRHRSLRAALDGSVESLRPETRRILAWASRFRGGWNLAHLQFFVTETEAMSAMEELVDASVITIDDQRATLRFQMLETIREFAGTLQPESSAEFDNAFIDCMCEFLAEQIDQPLPPRTFEALDLLDLEYDNTHAALEQAIAAKSNSAAQIFSRLWSHEIVRGRHREIVRLYTHHNNALVSGSQEFQNEINLGLAFAFEGLGQVDEAAAYFERARLGYAASDNRTYGALAKAGWLGNERRRSQLSLNEILRELLPISTTLTENQAVIAKVQLIYGTLLFYAASLEEASLILLSAQEAAQRANDEVVGVAIRLNRALVVHNLGHHLEAQAILAEANPFAARLGDPGRRAFQYELEGLISSALGQFERALASFQASKEIWQTLGNTFQVADQENSIARAHLKLGNLELACRAAKNAYENWKDCGDMGGVAVSLHTLTTFFVAKSESELAAKTYSAVTHLTQIHSLSFVQTELEFVESFKPKLPPAKDEDYSEEPNVASLFSMGLILS